jgi:hypothetical protein
MALGVFMKSLFFPPIPFLKYGALTLVFKTKVMTFTHSILKQDQAVFCFVLGKNTLHVFSREFLLNEGAR